MTPDQARAVFRRAERLYSATRVDLAIADMARKITAELADKDPICLCIMNGGLVLTGCLMPRLEFPLRVDYLHATRYREQTSGSDLHWKRQQEMAVADRTVLVIDDILDEGVTLASIVRQLQRSGAAAVLSAVLAEKDRPRTVDVSADFVGLHVPDRYVFGYGMDYKGYWRNAPGIFAAAPEDE